MKEYNIPENALREKLITPSTTSQQFPQSQQPMFPGNKQPSLVAPGLPNKAPIMVK